MTSYFLLESGDELIQEDGDILVLEDHVAAAPVATPATQPTGSGYSATQARERQARIDRVRLQAQIAQEDEEILLLL